MHHSCITGVATFALGGFRSAIPISKVHVGKAIRLDCLREVRIQRSVKFLLLAGNPIVLSGDIWLGTAPCRFRCAVLKVYVKIDIDKKKNEKMTMLSSWPPFPPRLLSQWSQCALSSRSGRGVVFKINLILFNCINLKQDINYSAPFFIWQIITPAYCSCYSVTPPIPEMASNFQNAYE